MSMNQISSFEESCPLNMGISYSMVMVRFAYLCVAHKVSVYACIVLCNGSSLGWGLDVVEYHSEVLQFIFKLHQLCCTCSWVGGNFKLVNWSLNCQNCSSTSAKGWWVSVSSLYSLDDSLSSLGIVHSGGTRSRGAQSWGERRSSMSWLPYLVVMVWVLWHIPKVFSRAFRGDCLQSQDMCMLQWWCRQWLCWALLGWLSSVYCEGLCKAV